MSYFDIDCNSHKVIGIIELCLPVNKWYIRKVWREKDLSNFYDILEIQIDATEDDIKIAYRKKIREFPNNTHPEQFQLIREAYEVLMNPITRNEYKVMSIHGHEINELKSTADEALEEEHYDLAIAYYEKILAIDSSFTSNRYNYALALFWNESFDDSIRQLKHLIIENPENAKYYYFLASAYEYPIKIASKSPKLARMPSK